MPDIELPSGKVIQGVPEGLSKEEIMSKAISSGQFTEEDFAAPASIPQARPEHTITPMTRGEFDAQSVAFQAQQDVGNAVEGIGNVIENVTNPIKDITAETVKQAPAETTLSTAGTLAGGRVGGVGGSFIGGAVGGTIGRELDELLGNMTSGEFGKTDDEPLLMNAGKSLLFQGGGELGGRLLVAPALDKLAKMSKFFDGGDTPNLDLLVTAKDISSQADDVLVNDALKASRFLEEKTGTPILTTAEITGGAVGDIKEEVLRKTGGASDAGRMFSAREDALKDSLNGFSKGAVSEAEFGGKIKEVFKSYGDALKENTFAKKKVEASLRQQKINVAGLSDHLKKALNNPLDNNGVPIEIAPQQVEKVSSLVEKHLTPKAGKQLTYKQIQDFELAVKDSIANFKATSGTGDALGVFEKQVIRPTIDNLVKLNGISNRGKAAQLYTARIQARNASAEQAALLNETKALRSIGTNEFAQDFKDMSGKKIASVLKESPEAISKVVKIIKKQRPELVHTMRANFREVIANQVTKGGKINKAALENILVKQGVAQDEFLKEAVGEEMLRHLKATNVVQGAIENPQLSGGVRAVLRSSGGSLPATIAASASDIAAFLLNLEPKTAKSLTKVLSEQLFDSKKAEKFINLSNTPLSSGAAYDLLTSMAADAARIANIDYTPPSEEEYLSKFE